jgi:CRISPR-associated protein Csd1
MILRSLVELESLLNRRRKLPRIGYEQIPLSYIIDLDRQGNIVGILHLERQTRQLPVRVVRTRAIAANLLWDNCEYVLGIVKVKDKARETIVAGAGDTLVRRDAFKQKIADLPATVRKDPGIQAVIKLLREHRPAAFLRSKFGKMIDDPSRNVTFRLRGSDRLVSDCDLLQQNLARAVVDEPIVTCSVTGKKGPIAILHPFFKRIPNALPKGGSLVSFNMPSASFYGHEQGENVPIIQETADRYGRALTFCLDSPDHRFRMADNVFVAWANTPTLTVDPMIEFMGRADNIPPDIPGAEKPRAIYEAPKLAIEPKLLEADYNILGLTGVQGRLATTFWQHGRLHDLVDNVNVWFDDLSLAGRRPDARSNGYRLLDMIRSLAAKRHSRKGLDYEGLSGRQQTELLYAAINRSPLPVQFPAHALRRLRVRGYPDDEHTLTAMLKLYLNRNFGKELTMGLDETRTDIGYLLGRSFAIIEHAQRAHLRRGERGPNVTVRDKFWSSASTTPRMAFPALDKLFWVYVKRTPRARWLIPEMEHIMQGVSGRPARLDLEQQSLFAVGYWQQRAALFARKPEDAPTYDVDDTDAEGTES